MKQISHFFRISQRPRYWLEVAMGYCLVILAGFVFISEQTCELANSQDQYQYIEASTDIKNGDHIIDNRPTHFSFSLHATLIEPEVRGAHGSHTDGDDDASDLSFIIPLRLTLGLHAENNLLLQLRQSFQIRPSISRIILFHCWRDLVA